MHETFVQFHAASFPKKYLKNKKLKFYLYNYLTRMFYIQLIQKKTLKMMTA